MNFSRAYETEEYLRIRRIIEQIGYEFLYHNECGTSDEMEIDHRCIDSFLQEFHVAEIV